MSVVIIGGHDRMVSQYKKICKEFKCKAKVFTQMSTNMDSHKMVKCALDGIDDGATRVVRCHTSSGTALSKILEDETPQAV